MDLKEVFPQACPGKFQSGGENRGPGEVLVIK